MNKNLRDRIAGEVKTLAHMERVENAVIADCRHCGCAGHATRCANDGCDEPPRFEVTNGE